MRGCVGFLANHSTMNLTSSEERWPRHEIEDRVMAKDLRSYLSDSYREFRISKPRDGVPTKYSFSKYSEPSRRLTLANRHSRISRCSSPCIICLGNENVQLLNLLPNPFDESEASILTRRSWYKLSNKVTS